MGEWIYILLLHIHYRNTIYFVLETFFLFIYFF
jgi:hypothetical protein